MLTGGEWKTTSGDVYFGFLQCTRPCGWPLISHMCDIWWKIVTLCIKDILQVWSKIKSVIPFNNTFLRFLDILELLSFRRKHYVNKDWKESQIVFSSLQIVEARNKSCINRHFVILYSVGEHEFRNKAKWIQRTCNAILAKDLGIVMRPLQINRFFL